MAAISTFGSTIKMGATLAGAYPSPDPSSLIGEVTSINLSGMKLNAIDVSGLSDRFKKFIPGMIDSGTIAVEVNLDTNDAQHMSIIDQLDASASTTAPLAKAFLIEYGDGSLNRGCKIKCVGIVTDLSTKGALDAALTASFTIKLTGSVDIADVP